MLAFNSPSKSIKQYYTVNPYRRSAFPLQFSAKGQLSNEKRKFGPLEGVGFSDFRCLVTPSTKTKRVSKSFDKTQDWYFVGSLHKMMFWKFYHSGTSGKFKRCIHHSLSRPLWPESNQELPYSIKNYQTLDRRLLGCRLQLYVDFYGYDTATIATLKTISTVQREL